MTTFNNQALPHGWETRRLKTVLMETDLRNANDGIPLLSLTRGHGLIPQSEASTSSLIAQDLSNYKVCESGDLVMNRMQAWSGMFAAASMNGLVSPDYTVFRPFEPNSVKYLEHLLKTPYMVTQFAQRSKGIGSGFNRLYTADFGDCTAPIPPQDEQAAIVRYLDHADDIINRYISAKEQLIVLMEEQCQVIIHQAVTQGLDPCVSFKPSPSHLIGDVPEHWQIRSFSSIAQPKSITGHDELELLSVYLYLGVIKFSDADERRTNPTSQDLSNYQLVEPGDFVLNNQQAWRGSVGISDLRGIVSPAYLVLSLSEDLHPQFANLLFRDRAMVHQYVIASRGVGTIQRNLYWPHLKQIIVPVPPRKEQHQIVEHAIGHTNKVNAAIGATRRQIELINEYRARLVADAVTGQIDVRHGVVELPD